MTTIPLAALGNLAVEIDGSGNYRLAIALDLENGPQSVPSLLTATGAGVISAGTRSVAISNAGDADASVAGGTLPPKTSVEWEAPFGGTLGELSYDATGTTLLIAEVR